jgi:hypothetical protein
MGKISKPGSEGLRQSLFVGAMSVIRFANQAASLPRHGCCNRWSASRASSPLSLWSTSLPRSSGP